MFLHIALQLYTCVVFSVLSPPVAFCTDYCLRSCRVWIINDDDKPGRPSKEESPVAPDVMLIGRLSVCRTIKWTFRFSFGYL